MGILKDCINKKKTNSIPIWFMRQAGRYLPEFRDIRSKNTNFVELCLNAKLSKEITLQPLKRFSFDAAIIFSDILRTCFLCVSAMVQVHCSHHPAVIFPPGVILEWMMATPGVAM